jgi:hypothetical protein
MKQFFDTIAFGILEYVEFSFEIQLLDKYEERKK